MSRRRVIVLQSYVPAYRAPFFTAVADRLHALGMSLVVAEGTPIPNMASRNDAVHGPWSASVATRWLQVGDRWLCLRNTRALQVTHEDIVVIEQALKYLDAYGLLMRWRQSRPLIAFWGHGRTYSVRRNAVMEWLKQWLTRRGDWLFTYTQAGAQFVVTRGFSQDRITVLRNTIDTRALRSDIDSIEDGEVAELRSKFGLTPGRTALFIGGVDAAKGIDFLMESALAVSRQLPGFVLLVAGDGAQLKRARAQMPTGGPVRFLGRLEGRDKAQALAVADLMLVPQWIGLVAVDSLVAGRPIVSTHHPSHAPERDYLVDGVTALFTSATDDAYADAIVQLLRNPSRLQSMQAACRTHSLQYDIDDMADAFVSGIQALAAERPESEGHRSGGFPLGPNA